MALPGMWLTVGRFRAAPVRLHASLPLGAFCFGRFTFAPGAWLGFVSVILLHELGHALLARRYGHRVLAIDVHGFGGECRYRGQVTPWQRSVIAWGGVLAQALLLAGSRVAIGLFGAPSGRFERELLDTFGVANAILIAVNLLPVAPLDGAEAWRLFPLWRRRRRRRQLESVAWAPARRTGRPEAETKEPALTPLSEESEAYLRDVLQRARDNSRR